MSKWAYEMTNDELVNAFFVAASQAGFSGSGLVIDPSAMAYADEAHYLSGVMLSRLENKQPPFIRGDEVTAKPGAYIRKADWWAPDIPGGQQRKIRRIYYRKHAWFLSFDDCQPEGHGWPCYLADDFRLAAAATPE